ncbi:MAG: sucrase ferredoxin [Bryobacteraceae bacterium]
MPETRDRFFCSLASRANCELLAGTVARIRSWLLIEHSDAWRRNAVADSRLFSPAVKAHLRGIGVERTLLVRQTHCPSWPARVMFVDSSADRPSIRIHEIEDYEQLLQPIASSFGGPGTDLMFAVCTHGRHDPCCAKFGMPVWRALNEYAPKRAWQCSHVGGDRFAANVVVFPYGLYYGRVSPEDVPQLVRLSEAGEVWLPGYRGRSCWPRSAQVAEYFLRRETGEIGIDAFRPLAAIGSTVEFAATQDGAKYRVEFAARREAFYQRLTCESDQESAVDGYELVSCERVP